MEAQIQQEFPDARVELIESEGGVFEVTSNGRLIFSKKQARRHPMWEEVRDKLR